MLIDVDTLERQSREQITRYNLTPELSRAEGVGLNCLLGAVAPERAIVFCVTQFFCLTH
mgnify:CR=1 FL=1